MDEKLGSSIWTPISNPRLGSIFSMIEEIDSHNFEFILIKLKNWNMHLAFLLMGIIIILSIFNST